MKPTVLLDCDGVLADFISGTLLFLNDRLGTSYTHDDVTEWEIGEALKLTEDEARDMRVQWKMRGFCDSLPVYEGAQKFVEQLKEIAHVHVLTSPMSSPTWHSERDGWLLRHFGLVHHDVTHTHDKYRVHGLALIDDKVEHLIAWKTYQERHIIQPGTAVLWTNNTNAHREDWRGARARGYSQALDFVRYLLNLKDV